MTDTKISALTALTTPSDDDIMPIVDDPGGAPTTKKVTWANLKATLKTYFDTLYSSASKAAYTDVATGTDDAKYVTSKAIKDSVNVPNVAPSTSGKLMVSNGTNWTSATLAEPQISSAVAPSTSGNVLTSNGSAWSSSAPAVTLANSVTLTNKTLTTPGITNPTITNYVETLYAPAAGSTFTIDLANGTLQKFTTNANCTLTLPSSVTGKSYTILVAYGGTHTLTWAGGSTIKWATGVAPTSTSASGKFDIYVFVCDGTNTYGADGGRNY